MTRDEIIKNALRRCGNTYSYSDNRSETYKLASDVLNDVLKSLATRDSLLFNSTTVKLTKIGINDSGENRFNLPFDFMNKIRFVDVQARIEGEFIYSLDDVVTLQYCRSITLEEFPDYMFEVMCLSLALAVAELDSTYADKLSILDTRLKEELKKIFVMQYSTKVREV